MVYCVMEEVGGKCRLLRSLSFGGGGYRLRDEWISVDEPDRYCEVFWSTDMERARAIATLVKAEVIGVPKNLVGI